MENPEPFEESVARWLRHRKSEATKATYRRDLDLWIKHCRSTASTDPGAPSQRVVDVFWDDLKVKHKYSALTIRRILSCLSAAFSAVRKDTINPFAPNRLERPASDDYKETDEITDEDARRLIEVAAAMPAKTRLRELTRLRNVALLHVLWSTGMRRISAVSIRRDKITRDGGVVTLEHKIKGQKRPAHSELSAEAVRAVDAWLAEAPDSPWLFCLLRDAKGEGRGRRLAALNPATVTSIVSQAAEAAGIHIHPHQFRAAFITRALDAGIPLQDVQAAAHHRDVRSTLRYDRGHRGKGVAAKLAAFRAHGPRGGTE